MRCVVNVYPDRASLTAPSNRGFTVLIPVAPAGSTHLCFAASHTSPAHGGGPGAPDVADAGDGVGAGVGAGAGVGGAACVGDVLARMVLTSATSCFGLPD